MSGRGHAARPATLESVEKAITETPFARVSWAVAGTDNANSGPRMISAPSSRACCVPCWAPGALPPSSLIRSWILGFWNSASAISAAFFMDCAATPALPLPDSGRINPILTCPVPTATGCAAGPEGPACAWKGSETEPAQAPSKGAPRIRPTAVRRVVPESRGPVGNDVARSLGKSLGRSLTRSLEKSLARSLGFRGPAIVSISLDLLTGQTGQHSPPNAQGGCIYI